MTMTQSPIETILAERLAKLENLKPLISLKSYGALSQKLAAERTTAVNETVRVEQATERRERAQILPKTLFSQRHLPRKTIRID